MILRKDPFTEERLRELGLNERQMRAMAYVREQGKIANREYQELNEVGRDTAHRELQTLVSGGILKPFGGGRNTVYRMNIG